MEIKSISAAVIFIVVMTILGSSIIGVGEMSDHKNDDKGGWIKKIMKNDNNKSIQEKISDMFDFNKLKGFMKNFVAGASNNNVDHENDDDYEKDSDKEMKNDASGEKKVDFNFNKLFGFMNSEESKNSINNFGINTGDTKPPKPPKTPAVCNNVPSGPTMTTIVDPITGDVEVTYKQSRNTNDNSYGVNAIGWGSKGHTFKALHNSDNLQFQFKNPNNVVVLDFYLDYITIKNSNPISGYDSLGPDGGDGSIVFGLRSNIISWDTSLAHNFNNLGYFIGQSQVVGPSTNLVIDSPPTNPIGSYNPASPFTLWDFTNSYKVKIKSAAFPGGFNSGYTVSFPSIHNSPAKKCPADNPPDDMIEHAFIDLGLSKVLVDPNGELNTGDEYFDNLITECSFHSDESIENSVCIICKLVDKKIEPCNDLFLGLTEFVHGTILNTQIDGVTVTAVAFEGRPNKVIIFDGDTPGDNDENPTPDPDLRASGICDDCAGLHIAIIPENISGSSGDGIVDTPNDSAAGGIQSWVFDKEWFVRSFDFVDYDANKKGQARAYDNPECSGTPVATADIKKSPNGGDGSVQTILLNANNVRCLQFEYEDSGGVTNIRLECIKKFDNSGVLSEGTLELPDGYDASTRLLIPLEHGVDVQKPVGVKIDVVQFIAKEEEHEHSDGTSTIVTNDGDGEDSIGTADSGDSAETSGGADTEDSEDTANGSETESNGDTASSADSEDSGDFAGCVVDEETSVNTSSSADSEDSGDASGGHDTEDSGDTSGGQDSGDSGDTSGGQDSEDHGHGSGNE